MAGDEAARPASAAARQRDAASGQPSGGFGTEHPPAPRPAAEGTEGTEGTEGAGAERNPRASLRVDATGVPGRTEALGILKTYKLFIGGAFPRSESGRVYPVTDPDGRRLANAPLASRKDARDAVLAARRAFPRWSGATAYNRGQVLYRVAEMLYGRFDQFQQEIAAAGGLTPAQARAQVQAAVDRWVWYAGWTDKISQVMGAANPVAGPYLNLSTPEPTGVVALLAPQKREDGLLGLVSVLAPVLATGNTAVLVASREAPLPALTLAEVLATSDVPPGAVNILSGDPAELGPHLAAHRDVNALDLTGAAAEPATDLEAVAAETLKRVYRPRRPEDWSRDPGTGRLTAFLETKTVWHPMGV